MPLHELVVDLPVHPLAPRLRPLDLTTLALVEHLVDAVHDCDVEGHHLALVRHRTAALRVEPHDLLGDSRDDLLLHRLRHFRVRRRRKHVGLVARLPDDVV